MDENASSVIEVYGASGSEGGGRFVGLALTIEGDEIVAASFRANGCPAAHIVAAGTCAFVRNRLVQDVSKLEPPDVILLVGGLPDGKGYYADMAIEALREALGKVRLEQP